MPLNESQRTYWGPDGWKQERGTLIEPRRVYSYELAAVGLDGSERRRLTQAPGAELGAVWSPDGRRFAYASDGEGLLVGQEGSAGRRVVSLRAGGGRWSPDGRKLLFAASTGGRDSYETTLYVVEVETALEGRTVDALSAIVVTEPLVNVTVGSFSPDGEQIVWGERWDRRDEDDEVIYGGQVIYVGSADGSTKRSIVELPGGEQSRQRLREVMWSPVEPRIMFWTTSTHYTGGGYGSDTNVIYVVNQDGSGLTKIHEAVGSIGGWAYTVVRWSPDGSRIAFGGGGHVATMASDGTDKLPLAKLEQRQVRGFFNYVTVAANPRPLHPPVEPAACSNGVVIPDPEANPGLVADCEALLMARDWVAEGVFLDWHDDLPIREWEGVTVAGRPARVTEVVLRGLGLQGRMPTSFGRLEHLERLDLWHNKIRGQIPREYGDLTKLRSLDLSYNLIVGAIPPELGRLTNLELLDLSHNQLSGPLPGELGALVDLRVLKLQDNNVGGAFPAELGNLVSLEELRVSRNRNLEGCVPDTLRAVEAVGTLLQRCWPEEDE